MPIAEVTWPIEMETNFISGECDITVDDVHRNGGGHQAIIDLGEAYENKQFELPIATIDGIKCDFRDFDQDHSMFTEEKCAAIKEDYETCRSKAQDKVDTILETPSQQLTEANEQVHEPILSTDNSPTKDEIVNAQEIDNDRQVDTKESINQPEQAIENSRNETQEKIDNVVETPSQRLTEVNKQTQEPIQSIDKTIKNDEISNTQDINNDQQDISKETINQPEHANENNALDLTNDPQKNKDNEQLSLNQGDNKDSGKLQQNAIANDKLTFSEDTFKNQALDCSTENKVGDKDNESLQQSSNSNDILSFPEDRSHNQTNSQDYSR